MKRSNCALLKLLSLSVISLGVTACHSSKTLVRANGNVSTTKIDYNEMKSDVSSRLYEVPQIGTLVAEAVKWLGVPYKYAGNDKNGVDCSGLTSQVYLKSLNVKMPRNSREQQRWCININKENLQPGDLVFFATGSDRNRVSHVGIYIGNGDIIHASSSRGVIVSNLSEKYYIKRYHSSGRPEIIQELYASASKRNKVKGKGKVNENNSVTTQNKFSPDNNLPTISVEQLIEMQVDSIASTITESEETLMPTTRLMSVKSSTPSLSPASPTSKPSKITAPAIITEEPTDTIFNQFFD